MNTKRSNLWDTEAHTHTHTHLQTLRMCCRTCACVSSCHWCSFKKSTSLPRELSAIADLNPHRYLSAASSFWTAVAAVTKQVHFCFSGTNPGASAERSRTIWMHTAQGFYRNGTQVESPCQHSLTSESYYRTGGPGLYMITAAVNDYFLFLLFLVSGVVGWKYSAELFLFLVFPL